ncbi:MAG: hypothetical protein G01um101444_427, partial [Parcubacteria group bacterium Gr01-1014_44]
MGWGMGAGAQLAHTLAGQAIQRAPAQAKGVYDTAYAQAIRDGKSPDDAMWEGLDALAQTPEGQQTLAILAQEWKTQAAAQETPSAPG